VKSKHLVHAVLELPTAKAAIQNFAANTGTNLREQKFALKLQFKDRMTTVSRRNNARNNARCTQARKATHGLDGQHQDVDRTLRGRVNQNDGAQGQMEKVRPWCGQPSDRGRLKNRTVSRNIQPEESMRTAQVSL